MTKIKVENKEITIILNTEGDFISLTDMANAKESESRAADIIKNWIRTRYTLEFLGTWEQIKNAVVLSPLSTLKANVGPYLCPKKPMQVNVMLYFRE